jgi:hypothetical protein
MPLLVPLALIGVPDFILAALDAPLRVLTVGLQPPCRPVTPTMRV